MEDRGNRMTDQPTIDTLTPKQAIGAMVASHLAAVRAVDTARDAIATAARLMADRLHAGGTVHYAAAGSSGLMALADAAELPGTFSVPQARVRIHMAGGVPSDGAMPGDVEDDVAAARRAAQAVGSSDLAIVLSASGTTPYALAFAEAAKSNGAPVIAITTTPDSPLLRMADIAICAPCGTEVVEGSTRLGAGTAQKVVLNVISTLAGSLMGHVHRGLMVNLHADNAKLRARSVAIVARLSGVGEREAEEALAATNGAVKPAVLVARGLTAEQARQSLEQGGGHLGRVIEGIPEGRDKPAVTTAS